MRHRIFQSITLSSALLIAPSVFADDISEEDKKQQQQHQDQQQQDQQQQRQDQQQEKQQEKQQQQRQEQQQEKQQQQRQSQQQEQRQEKQQQQQQEKKQEQQRQGEQQQEKKQQEKKQEQQRQGEQQQEKKQQEKKQEQQRQGEQQQEKQQQEKKQEQQRQGEQQQEKKQQEKKQEQQRQGEQQQEKQRQGQREESRKPEEKGADHAAAKEHSFSHTRLKENQTRWGDRGKTVRQSYEHDRHERHVFDDHYWHDFHEHNRNWHFRDDYNWSARPMWPSLVAWFPWGWSSPEYYYYGDSGNVYYTSDLNADNYTYVGADTDFVQQAVNLANSSPSAPLDESNWMPLGTFAMTSDDDSDRPTQEYLTLAVSKNGSVSGAYFDVKEGTPLQIEGAVDKRSQRMAWKFVGQDWPVMETALYNVTQDESTAMVYYSSSDRATRVLTRVQ